MQTNWDWARKYSTALPYEGLKNKNCDTGRLGPYGCGDPTIHGWGPSNLGLYSGCLSGAFGAMIEPTSLSHVLALNLNATDTFAPKSFPTKLLYNPNPNKVTVQVPIGPGRYTVWDTVHNVELKGESSGGKLQIDLEADDAVVFVLIPKGTTIFRSNGRLIAEGTVVDYSVPTMNE